LGCTPQIPKTACFIAFWELGAPEILQVIGQMAFEGKGKQKYTPFLHQRIGKSEIKE
jgi:hypothetical protein